MKNKGRYLLWAMVGTFLLFPAWGACPAAWGADESIESVAMTYIDGSDDALDSFSGDIVTTDEVKSEEVADSSSGADFIDEVTSGPAASNDIKEEENMISREETEHSELGEVDLTEQAQSEDPDDKAGKDLEEFKILLQALKSRNPMVRAAAALALGDAERLGRCERDLK